MSGGACGIENWYSRGGRWEAREGSLPPCVLLRFPWYYAVMVSPKRLLLQRFSFSCFRKCSRRSPRHFARLARLGLSHPLRKKEVAPTAPAAVNHLASQRMYTVKDVNHAAISGVTPGWHMCRRDALGAAYTMVGLCSASSLLSTIVPPGRVRREVHSVFRTPLGARRTCVVRFEIAACRILRGSTRVLVNVRECPGERHRSRRARSSQVLQDTA